MPMREPAPKRLLLLLWAVLLGFASRTHANAFTIRFVETLCQSSAPCGCSTRRSILAHSLRGWHLRLAQRAGRHSEQAFAEAG